MALSRRARTGLAVALACLATTLQAPPSSAATAGNTPVGGFPSFDGEVFTLARSGDTIYVGGAFSHVTDKAGRTFTRRGAAAVDAATGDVRTWNPNVRGKVLDLAPRGKVVYLVGNFSRVGGARRFDAARVTARSGDVRRFAPRLHARRGVPSAVNAVVVTKRKVFLGGSFTGVGTQTRRKLAAFRTDRPFRLSAWTPRAGGGDVHDLVVRRAGVYVGGSFTTINGRKSTRHLSLVTRGAGRVRTDFNPAPERPALSIAIKKRSAYVAFSGLGGAVGRYDATNGNRRWFRRLDGDAQAVRVLDGVLYVGGHFAHYCNGTRNLPNGGACDGSAVLRRRAVAFRPSDGALTSWAPQFNGEHGVWALVGHAKRDRLFTGGDFTAVHQGATPRLRFAVFSTS